MTKVMTSPSAAATERSALPPSPFEFIVSLFNTLGVISSRHGIERGHQKANALPEESRDILLTLHVLFPHVLLDALDLLDRGCVLKLVVVDKKSSETLPAEEKRHKSKDGGQSTEPRATTDGPENAAIEMAQDAELAERNVDIGIKPKPVYDANNSGHERKRDHEYPRVPHHIAYHVLSTRSQEPVNTATAAKTKYTRDDGQRGRHTSDVNSGKSQHVHLRAWNCSCPAFAFAAYSSAARTLATASTLLQSATGTPGGCTAPSGTGIKSKMDNNDKPSFGGLSIARVVDVGGLGNREGLGRQDGTVQADTQETIPPVCKHLLACFLGELCPEFFGPFPSADEPGEAGERRTEGKDRISDSFDGRSGMREATVTLVEAAGIAGGGGDVGMLSSVI